MGKLDMALEVRVWLENNAGFHLGPGKVELLRRLHELGSLKQAAESLSMSYSKAWGRLKKTEETLGKALLAKKGGNKSGYDLTPFAKDLIDRYGRWLKDLQEYALRTAKRDLPDAIHVLRLTDPEDAKK